MEEEESVDDYDERGRTCSRSCSCRRFAEVAAGGGRGEEELRGSGRQGLLVLGSTLRSLPDLWTKIKFSCKS